MVRIACFEEVYFHVRNKSGCFTEMNFLKAGLYCSQCTGFKDEKRWEKRASRNRLQFFIQYTSPDMQRSLIFVPNFYTETDGNSFI